jgi:hypothetical protein
VTAPAGASPFSGPDAYEATVAAFAEAVAAAVAGNAMQQQQAQAWFDARLREDASAHVPGAADAPNL